VDLVALNAAPPLLRHRAIRSQRIVLDRDPKARLRLEARALTEYLDTKPLRAELEAIRAAGRDAYMADFRSRLAAEHAIRYLELDDGAVWDALGRLDDLRRFAACAQGPID